MAKRQKTAVRVPKKPDLAKVIEIPVRTIIIVPKGIPDTYPIELSTTQGLWHQLRTLGKRVCYVNLLLRTRIWEMQAKNRETKEPNPYFNDLIKFSSRSGWVNRPTDLAKFAFQIRNGIDPSDVEEHQYADPDPNCPLVREHRTNGTLYMAFQPHEGFQYHEALVRISSGESVTREQIEPYCADKKSTYFKNPKLSSIIELKGYYYYGPKGNRKRHYFRFRNMDNISKMEEAIAKDLPALDELAESFLDTHPDFCNENQ